MRIESFIWSFFTVKVIVNLNTTRRRTLQCRCLPDRRPQGSRGHQKKRLQGAIFRTWSFGLRSRVFHDYVSLRRAQRAAIQMHSGWVGVWQRSPSRPLQCRQSWRRGKDLAPDMQVGCGFLWLGHWTNFGKRILNTRRYCSLYSRPSQLLITYDNYKICLNICSTWVPYKHWQQSCKHRSMSGGRQWECEYSKADHWRGGAPAAGVEIPRTSWDVHNSCQP